jgi:hypothetical protein
LGGTAPNAMIPKVGIRSLMMKKCINTFGIMSFGAVPLKLHLGAYVDLLTTPVQLNWYCIKYDHLKAVIHLSYFLENQLRNLV